MKDSQKQQAIIDSLKGKKIEDAYYESEGDYWVIVLEGGAETCFRFMADL